MNAYDFDGTVYSGDCSFDYTLFCIRRYPRLLQYLPTFLWAGIRYRLHLCGKTAMKAAFFSYLKSVPAESSLVEEFWASHRKELCSWYRKQCRPEDVIISASPEFLLRPICHEMGVRTVIGSRVDPRSGRFTGSNCHGEEKVSRLYEVFGPVSPERFYSDSRSDEPLARLARHAFLVHNHGSRRVRFRPFPIQKSDLSCK